MRADKIGSETVLAQIVQLVAQAQRSRAPMQRLADKVSFWFVLAVLAAAIVTFVVWGVFGPEPSWTYAVVNAVAVLIIACPCALGLATPMTVMVASGRAAQAGVLFRDAEAIERLRTIDTLIVDKTGTLTQGRPAFRDVIGQGNVTADEVLRLAASLDQGSEHPLADAIVAEARRRNLSLSGAEEFESVTGLGVRGRVDGRALVLGNTALMREVGADPGALADAAEKLRLDGATAMFLAVDGVAAGLIAVADPIKDGAAAAIKALHAAGLRVVMATGDGRTTAEAVARHLGIDEVHGEVRPKDKADLVQRLKAEGRRVAMAGDGINDAPALAAADVGIAMGTGTDVAMSSAQVTLVKGDLRGIARAREISSAAVTNMKQNLDLCLSLQRTGRARRRGRALSGVRRAAEPDACRARHEPVIGVGRGQCLAACAMHRCAATDRAPGRSTPAKRRESMAMPADTFANFSCEGHDCRDDLSVLTSGKQRMPSTDNKSLPDRVCAYARQAALAVASLGLVVSGTVAAAEPPVTVEYQSIFAGYRHFDAAGPGGRVATGQ